METQYVKQYSPALDRDMECKIYGRAGRPVLYIPCQDGRFFDFESFRLTDTWAPLDRVRQGYGVQHRHHGQGDLVCPGRPRLAGPPP